MTTKADLDRAALLKRKLPQMQLFNYPSRLEETSSDSPTPATTANPATSRFTVCGNVIITGGAGTLALEGARALLEHGAGGVALFDINLSAVSTAVSALQADFPKALIVSKQVDVTDVVNVTSATKEVAEELGSVDILCCFAGIVNCVHAIEMAPAQWRRTLEINTTGGFFCAQAAARVMISQKSGGSIVLISSMSGHAVNYPQPQMAYNVSKSALLHMKSCLAAEWARYGIRTNTISPGYMDTILNEGAGLEETRKIWNDRNPMGRMGQPRELTGPLVLLCSEAGSYINGADLLVDGGQTVF